MEQLIKTIVKPLVDYPEAIHVEQDEQNTRIAYKLSVHPDDMGKVIGKQGRIASAIRTIVTSAAGSRQGKRIHLDIVD